MKTDDWSPRRMAAMNRKLAKSRWGAMLTKGHLSMLDELSRQFQFSVAMGDVVLLDGRWYVTHTGLVRLARNSRCAGVQFSRYWNFRTLQVDVGHSRPLSSNPAHAAASSDMEMPIPPMYRH